MADNGPDQTTDGESRFIVKTTADSHMSWIRTRFSAESTMMSWIRTAVSLIGFGFTIVQFFERFSGFSEVDAAMRPWAPRYFGLALIGVGVLTLIITSFQYRSFINYMWNSELAPLAGLDPNGKRRATPIYTISVALIFVGLFAFFAIVLRAI